MNNLLKQLGKLDKDITKLNDRFLKESLDYLESRAVLHLSMTTGKGGYPLTDEIINSFKQILTTNLGILRNEAIHAA